MIEFLIFCELRKLHSCIHTSCLLYVYKHIMSCKKPSTGGRSFSALKPASKRRFSSTSETSFSTTLTMFWDTWGYLAFSCLLLHNEQESHQLIIITINRNYNLIKILINYTSMQNYTVQVQKALYTGKLLNNELPLKFQNRIWKSGNIQFLAKCPITLDPQCCLAEVSLRCVQ